ncbi:MAG: ABC transporter ATP-binding protein [Candidatus Korarchaeota archaeon]|nr:ABC transporter ATP-binding protein [Candidatus Korarchaeota archaeon]
MPAVEVSEVRKSYGDVVALDGVSLTVEEGEIYGLLGPNGAGKTTLMEIIAGLRAPDSGEVRVLGVDVVEHPRRVRELVGFNPQETLLYDPLTARENLEFVAALYSMPRDEFQRRLEELTDLLGMADFLDRRTGKLSGGQQRRVSLAASLLHRPPVIILDEPTVGLDPDARRDFWNLIEGLRSEGRTLLISTHYMEEADELCDRVAIIDRGRIVAVGRPEELKARRGGRSKVIVRVRRRHVDRALEILGDHSPALTADGIVIEAEDPRTLVPDLVSLLQSRGVDPESVEIRSPTLEDVFLNLTGRRLAEVVE